MRINVRIIIIKWRQEKKEKRELESLQNPNSVLGRPDICVLATWHVWS